MSRSKPWSSSECLTDFVLDAILRGDAVSLRRQVGDGILVVLFHSQKCPNCRRRRISWTRDRLARAELQTSPVGFWPFNGIIRTHTSFDEVERALKRAESLHHQRYGSDPRLLT